MSIFKIPPDEFALISSLLGVGIANKLDVNEQNSIGNFLESVGQIILTISAQEQLQQALIEKEKQNEQLKIQIEILEKQVELLSKQIGTDLLKKSLRLVHSNWDRLYFFIKVDKFV